MSKEVIKLLINEYERQCIFAEKNLNIDLSEKLEKEIKLLESKLKECY
jgi:ABC-type Zn uptake system ZnuABC Zn-binding protein ZnuA